MASAAQRLSARAAAAAKPVEVEVRSKAGEEEIELSRIKFDPTQPRKAFHQLDGRIDVSDEEYIAELAAMIDKNGLIHAITVREMEDGAYLVVVGECRTRAHLLLGREKIRARVRNDLTGRRDRLIYQVIENIGRKDLNDYEVTEAILELMQGSDEAPPMKQVEISKLFGKSEGWVSKFVKFGDQELQRVWVKSGIANTPDKVLWLSALPMALQMEIRRRVELPEDHPEWLVRPLQRDVIERLKREARPSARQEAARAEDVGLPTVRLPVMQAPAASGGLGAVGSGGADDPLAVGGELAEIAVFAQVASDDVIGQALAEAAVDGRPAEKRKLNADTAAPAATYQLPADVRAAIVQSASTALVRDAAATGGVDVDVPPVRVKVTVGNILALADILRSNEKLSGYVANVWCDLSIPGDLAQLIANDLMGVRVSDQQVPATLQRELTKLR